MEHEDGSPGGLRRPDDESESDAVGLPEQADTGISPAPDGPAGPLARGAGESSSTTLGGSGEGEEEATEVTTLHILERLIAQSGSWSGLLPAPTDFAKYPAHVQERIMAWNDAWSTDESRRQDKLVDAEVSAAKSSLWLAASIAVLCLILAAFFFARDNNWAGSAFIAMPIMGFLSTLVKGALPSRRSGGDE